MAARSCLVVLAAVSAAHLASALTVPCAVVGQGYNDPLRNDTANGARVHSAAVCQQTCQNTVFCEYFTWYSNTGGCWLQGINAALTVVDENATAGPVRCPAITSSTEAPTETTSTSTEAINTTENITIMAKGAITDESTGDEFPWWGWVLIALGVAAAGLICFLCIYFSQDGKKKKSDKRGTKLKKNKDVEVAEDDPVAEPLMATTRQLEAESAPATSVAPAYVSAAPMAMPAYSSVAAPVVSMAPPMYMTAQPAPVAAPPVSTSCPNCGNLYASDSLFCRMCGQRRVA